MRRLREAFKRSTRRALARFGYELRRVNPWTSAQRHPSYVERQEAGPVNLKDKLARQERGEPFEWPDIVALNQTVATMRGSARNIVELGGGTGTFAWHATQDPTVVVTCSEFDAQAHEWAVKHRSRSNLRYVNGPVSPDQGPFDLAVAIEVIEHLTDFAGFLHVCAALAPRAIITTPNKLRSLQTATAGPPHYYQHVREWTAGEFYWVLRAHYDRVQLYAMPEPSRVGAIPITVMSELSPVIAICERDA